MRLALTLDTIYLIPDKLDFDLSTAKGIGAIEPLPRLCRQCLILVTDKGEAALGHELQIGDVLGRDGLCGCCEF